MKPALATTLICLLTAATSSVWAEDTSFPRYKPSSRSPAPLDIRTDAYGASRQAPDAIGIAEQAPDFTVPQAGGGSVSLGDARANGPVAVIFYRGHW